MTDITGCSGVEVRSTKNKGRGVFARRSFRRSETIESVPVIFIPGDQKAHIQSTVLDLYVYKFGPEDTHLVIALGYGSLYNHSFSPNADFIRSWEEQLIHFVAVRDIEEGEEITVNYNGTPDDQSPIWFDVVEAE